MTFNSFFKGFPFPEFEGIRIPSQLQRLSRSFNIMGIFLSVGELAIIISILCIILAIFIHKVVEKTLSAFVTSRLLRTNEALYITTDDLLPPQTFFALYRFRKYHCKLVNKKYFLISNLRNAVISVFIHINNIIFYICFFDIQSDMESSKHQ